MELTYFVSCVYVLQVSNGDGVVELCGDAYFIIKSQCVVCDVYCGMLLLKERVMEN